MRYSIYKNESTGGSHLHEAEGVVGDCRSYEDSVCKKSTRAKSNLISSCLTADEARLKAANIGQSFCGICVSHLYKND